MNILKILNFSHPLSEDVLNEILELENSRAVHKYESITQTIIPCQFNMNAYLWRQIELLLQNENVYESPDLIVPPALSAAAFLMAQMVSGNVRIIWLKRDGDAMPPKWVLGGIE